MAYPPVVVVNSSDKVIGRAPLAEAWDKGLIHRIVFVIVEDSRGRILLHKRAEGMQLYPGRWDTAGGHVDVTTDYEESAKLELREELGIKDVPLTEEAYMYTEEAYDNGAHAKRFIKIFWTLYNGEPGELSDDEVVATRWFTKEQIAELGKHPEQIAEGLHRCLPRILEKYEDHEHQAAAQAHRPVLDIR